MEPSSRFGVTIQATRQERKQADMRTFRIVSIAGALTGFVILVGAADARASVLCLHPNGSLAVRDVCAKNETTLDPVALGLTGPPGPQGPAGPTGPTGQEGPAGPAGGVTGYEIVTKDTPPQNVDEQIGFVACPAGKRVLGGGSFVFNDVTPISGDQKLIALADSHPFPGFPSADLDSWRVRAVRYQASISSWHLRIFAVCAPVQ
jgi:hypothetical protein